MRPRPKLAVAASASLLGAVSTAYQVLARREPMSLAAVLAIVALSGMSALMWAAMIRSAIRARWTAPKHPED